MKVRLVVIKLRAMRGSPQNATAGSILKLTETKLKWNKMRN